MENTGPRSINSGAEVGLKRDDDECNPLQQSSQNGASNTPSATNHSTTVETKMFEHYYQEALKVQGNMNKNDEFDFVPSLFNITIPLNSPGYPLAILLVILTFVLNHYA
jgi:hypothetical protein